jgi:hypothetical protein
MVTGRRVKRLREMVDQIERLPVSPDRDRLLSEVRSRAVDVDTGVTPRAMLPMREPAPPPVLPRPPKRDRSTSIRRTAPTPPAPAVARPASAVSSRYESLEQPPWLDEWLSLGDSLQLCPLPEVRGRGGRPVPPWTLGLRG